jgi:hypothetical protein
MVWGGWEEDCTEEEIKRNKGGGGGKTHSFAHSSTAYSSSPIIEKPNIHREFGTYTYIYI